jgi:hypothetical protein
MGSAIAPDGSMLMQCQSCHDSMSVVGSTTRVGWLNEPDCQSCHTAMPSTVKGGPHGLHPVGQAWISQHESAVEAGGAAQCTACHGADYRGTVLSRSQADRTLRTELGTKICWRGYQIGCYTCHQGPSNESANPNRPAQVSNVSTNTPINQALSIMLPATHAHGTTLTLRIVSQPAHGSVGLNNGVATYFPEPGFEGVDSFTFAAWDGSADSNLGTVTVSVGRGPMDGVRPTVTITYPTSGTRVPQGPLSITGTAWDNVQVTQVVYQVNSSGWLPVAGTANWQANPALAQRTNRLEVYSVDSSGNRSRTNTLSFIFVMTDRLAVETNGWGTVSPNLNGQILEVGLGYRMTAKPHPTNLFGGWSLGGTLISTQAVLSFIMQSNMVLVANFVPNPFVSLQGTYKGLFYPGSLDTNAPLEATVTNSGFFTLALNRQGQASGKLLLAGRTYTFRRLPFSLQLEAHGQVNRRAPLDPLQFNLTLDPNNGGVLSGQVFATDWQSRLRAYPVWSATNWTGRATFLLFGDALSLTSVPPGDGAGIITVDHRGGVRLAGRLPEGTVISRGSALLREGRCPIYVPLQGGRGMLLGWLQFASDNPPFDVLGDSLVWIKAPATTAAEKHYPNGFTVARELVGSKYRPPTAGQNVLNWTNGVAEFGGGNLGIVVSNQVQWVNNRLTVLENSHQVSLTVTLTSGLCSGTFLHPETGNMVRFKGALLQNPGWGGGWFQGTNQGGYFWLGPLP